MHSQSVSTEPTLPTKHRLTSQVDTPASKKESEGDGQPTRQLVDIIHDHSLQPCDFACEMHPAKVAGAMYPLFASPVLAGLPMTTLLSGTPEAMIWKTAELGQVEEDAVSRPAQVVYSVEPSVGARWSELGWSS